MPSLEPEPIRHRQVYSAWASLEFRHPIFFFFLKHGNSNLMRIKSFYKPHNQCDTKSDSVSGMTTSVFSFFFFHCFQESFCVRSCRLEIVNKGTKNKVSMSSDTRSEALGFASKH